MRLCNSQHDTTQTPITTNCPTSNALLYTAILSRVKKADCWTSRLTMAFKRPPIGMLCVAIHLFGDCVWGNRNEVCASEHPYSKSNDQPSTRRVISGSSQEAHEEPGTEKARRRAVKPRGAALGPTSNTASGLHQTHTGASERQLRVRLLGQNHTLEVGLNARKRRIVIGLETHDHDRRRVRRTC